MFPQQKTTQPKNFWGINMGGLFGRKTSKAFAPQPKKETKSNKADAGADAISGISGAKATIGLNKLGGSTPQNDEGTVTTVGSSPANKKKPTVFLLGEKP
jgi:hypothetical protein